MGEYSIKDESAREQAATRLARRVIRLGRKVNSMKIARPVCPYPSILIQPEAHPPRVRRPWQLPFFRGLSLKKKKDPLPPPLPSPFLVLLPHSHSSFSAIQRVEWMRTKARGLPRKIVINRRVADLGERASPHFYNACYVRRSWPSLSHPPLKAANCIYELSERSSSDWLLTRRPISANLPTYIGWGGEGDPFPIPVVETIAIRDYLKSTIMVLRNPKRFWREMGSFIPGSLSSSLPAFRF